MTIGEIVEGMILEQPLQLKCKRALIMKPLLQLEQLNVTFATQTGEVNAVRDVSFSIPESGTLGLVGESGSVPDHGFRIARVRSQTLLA